MKLASLALLFVINVWMVLAAPAPINYSDGKFNYWLSDTNKKATIMGVDNKFKNEYELTLNPWVTYNGQRYYVNQIGAGAFSNTGVVDLIVPTDVEIINFSYRAFNDAKNIRTIDLRNEKVTADIDAFINSGRNLSFIGKGCESLVNSYAKNLLKLWNLPVNKDYTNLEDIKRMRDLYTLARKVKEYVTYYSNTGNPSNTAVVMVFGKGDSNGIARVYRNLAINMGIPINDVQVGGDNQYFSWNYVYVLKKWYNVDIIHYNFGKYSTYESDLFTNDSKQREVIQKAYGYSSVDDVTPIKKWIIFTNRYNYFDEWKYNYPYKQVSTTEVFEDWLIRNRQGVRAD